MRIDWKDWYKDFNRPLDLFQAQFYSRSCDGGLKELLGVSFKHQLYIFRENSADGYFLKKERVVFDEYVLKNRLKNQTFLKHSNKKILKQCRELESFFLSLGRYNFSQLNRRQLLVLLNKSTKLLNKRIAAIWIGFLIDKVVEQRLEQILKYSDLPMEETYAVIQTADKANHIVQEELDLMKIAAIKGNKNNALIKHHSKYSYIPCYSVGVAPYTIEYFKKRILGVSTTQAKVRVGKLSKELRKNKHRYELLLKNKSLTKDSREFIRYAHDFIFFKDYRSHFRSLVIFNLRKLLSSVSQRYSITLNQLTLLLQSEISLLLSRNTAPAPITMAIAKRKSNKYVYLYSGGQEKVFYKTKDFPIDLPSKVASIRGTIAFAGKTRGVVRVIMNPNEINKVKTGDILVTSMTRPDYVSAMKRAAAIVTDEGGVLCHAAIISRELHKPCIIGTRVATEVLKDGDMVEVDSNKGIVRRL